MIKLNFKTQILKTINYITNELTLQIKLNIIK